MINLTKSHRYKNKMSLKGNQRQMLPIGKLNAIKDKLPFPRKKSYIDILLLGNNRLSATALIINEGCSMSVNKHGAEK